MPTETDYLPVRVNKKMNQALEELAVRRHITKSALVRQLIKNGIDSELPKESVDYIRTQLNEEVKAVCLPQFERIAKLEAKIGYQSVSNFYLLNYIISTLLPATKQKSFEEILRKSKAMAVAYLKFNEKEFAEFMKSEDKALEFLDL